MDRAGELTGPDLELGVAAESLSDVERFSGMRAASP